VSVRNNKHQIVQNLLFTLNITKPAAAPKILAITGAPASLNFTFATTAGALYLVQCKTNLTQPDWIDVGGQLLAETNSLTFTDTNIVNCPQKFYRLLLVP